MRTSLELNRPQIKVDINRSMAAEMGISATDLSQTLRYLFGEVDISHVDRDGKRYDVVAEIDGCGWLTPDILRNVYVWGSGDRLISMDNLVQIREYVRYPMVEGKGVDGKHLGTKVFPGSFTVVQAQVVDDRIEGLLEDFQEFRQSKAAHQHLKAVVMDIVASLDMD